jgi:hypothetical protein
MADTDPVLTHHVNIRNPKTKKVETFEPQDGSALPAWARDALTAENHVAFVERTPRAEALVKGWQASKLAAEAARMAQEG